MLLLPKGQPKVKPGALARDVPLQQAADGVPEVAVIVYDKYSCHRMTLAPKNVQLGILRRAATRPVLTRERNHPPLHFNNLVRVSVL